MIDNLNKAFPSVVNRLNGSCYEFHLTGSRFFGQVEKHSDWDFFVEHSDDVIIFLTELGFSANIMTTAYLGDPEVVEVMSVKDFHQGTCTRIDIQLVKDVSLKLKAQDLLAKYWGENGIPNKVARKDQWRGILVGLRGISGNTSTI